MRVAPLAQGLVLAWLPSRSTAQDHVLLSRLEPEVFLKVGVSR